MPLSSQLIMTVPKETTHKRTDHALLYLKVMNPTFPIMKTIRLIATFLIDFRQTWYNKKSIKREVLSTLTFHYVYSDNWTVFYDNINSSITSTDLKNA